jgi:hypothetical protein
MVSRLRAVKHGAVFCAIKADQPIYAKPDGVFICAAPAPKAREAPSLPKLPSLPTLPPAPAPSANIETPAPPAPAEPAAAPEAPKPFAGFFSGERLLILWPR